MTQQPPPGFPQGPPPQGYPSQPGYPPQPGYYPPPPHGPHPPYGPPPGGSKNLIIALVAVGVVAVLVVGFVVVRFVLRPSIPEPTPRAAGEDPGAGLTLAPPTTTEEKDWLGDYSYSAVADPCELVTSDAMATWVPGPPTEQRETVDPPDSLGGGELECRSDYPSTGPANGGASTSHTLTVELDSKSYPIRDSFDSRIRSISGTADDAGTVSGLGTQAHSSVDLYSDGLVAWYYLIAWDSNAYVEFFVLVGNDTPMTRSDLDAVFIGQGQQVFDKLRT